jgi:C4-dicarboxylate transporter DctM subunit
MFFGAISGSGPATVGAIGTILLPFLYKAYYDKYYSSALVAIAGGLGVMIPPSIPLIMYGCVTSTSIGSLFLAGVGPGIVVGVILMVINYFICRKTGWKGDGTKFNWKELGKAVWKAKWALLMPFIILGGIYGGVFTPTEAATIAVFYSIFIGLFVYKELKLKDIARIFFNAAPFVGGMMMTFAPAAVLGAVLSLLGVPQAVSSFLLSITDNLYIILFIVNIFLLLVGMVMDAVPSIIIFGPILFTALVPLGVDPIHLGIIMTINLAIGFVTPPVCANMFVAASLTGFPINEIIKKSWPFIIGLFIALMIITYIPAISVGICHLFGY